MKCEECGRGITWRRIARDGAVAIGGVTFCGGCVVRGVVDQELEQGVDLHGYRPLLYLPRALVDHKLHPDQGAIRGHFLELDR